MAFTDNSDLFVSVHEEGINFVIKHLMRQRPSIFNYGTALIQAKPDLLCETIETAPGVTKLITVMDPIPLLGASNFAMNYCFQLTDLEIEFHPGNVITLPSELDPPLKQQHFAFRARGCGGIGCPSKNDRPLFDALFDLDRLESRQTVPTVVPGNSFSVGNPLAVTTAQKGLIGATQFASGAQLQSATGIKQNVFVPSDAFVANIPNFPVFPFPTTHVFPTRKLSCFCMELFAAGHGSISGPAGNQKLKVELDDLEIVDLAPEGLENSLECYILLVINKAILAQVNEALSNTIFNLIEFGEFGSLQVSASTAVPDNPAIEENQLKTFINMDTFDVNIPPIVIKEDGGDGEGPEITKTLRSRTRTGPFHLTGALSEETFLEIFRSIQANTTFDITFEPRPIIGSVVKAGGRVVFGLEGGNINFTNSNLIEISQLNIDWDVLRLDLIIDLPKMCIPPFKICVPVLGCTPQWCGFEGENDISFSLNIPSIFTSELSMNLRPKVFYGVSSAGNKWILQLEPVGPVDIDIIDISDTIGEILDDAINAVVDALGLPDVVDDILATVVDLIRGVLDIGDDIGEWIKDVVFDLLGLELGIDNLLFKYFTDDFKLIELDDPVEILPGDAPLIPVKVPIQFLDARVNNKEMIIEADLEE